MRFIPVMLNVTDKKLLIVGGGRAAALKLQSLASKFEEITVVSERFDPLFDGSDVKKVVRRIDSPQSVAELIDRETIVVIASDDLSLNEKLREYCKMKGVLFNSVDRIDSPFIFPAAFTSNGVTVSVSTEGRSPSLSRFLKRQLAQLAQRYSQALPTLERLREVTANEDHGERARFFDELLEDPEFWRLVEGGDEEGAWKYGLKLLSELKREATPKR
ncbi:MAG: precorrin-2 dehydrogenase/sirohydrochlorin ferrochelatase family protein [Thermoplasmata archaeon]